MQTFLPFPDFARSAAVLDRLRLGKQRVEAYQILRTLTGQSAGWVHHPATLMWRGYERTLAQYGAEMCLAWVGRGYADTLLPRFEAAASLLPVSSPPPWLGDDKVHSSHRSALLRKLPEHYRPLGWTDNPAAPYFWPVQIRPGRPG